MRSRRRSNVATNERRSALGRDHCPDRRPVAPKCAPAGKVALIADYLAHLEVERRMSAHTLDAYRRDLAPLSEWAQAPGLAAPETLQPEQLRAFVAADTPPGLPPKRADSPRIGTE